MASRGILSTHRKRRGSDTGSNHEKQALPDRFGRRAEVPPPSPRSVAPPARNRDRGERGVFDPSSAADAASISLKATRLPPTLITPSTRPRCLKSPAASPAALSSMRSAPSWGRTAPGSRNGESTRRVPSGIRGHGNARERLPPLLRGATPGDAAGLGRSQQLHGCRGESAELRGDRGVERRTRGNDQSHPLQLGGVEGRKCAQVHRNSCENRCPGLSGAGGDRFREQGSATHDRGTPRDGDEYPHLQTVDVLGRNSCEDAIPGLDLERCPEQGRLTEELACRLGTSKPLPGRARGMEGCDPTIGLQPETFEASGRRIRWVLEKRSDVDTALPTTVVKEHLDRSAAHDLADDQGSRIRRQGDRVSRGPGRQGGRREGIAVLAKEKNLIVGARSRKLRGDSRRLQGGLRR